MLKPVTMSPPWYNIMLFPFLMIVNCYQIASSLQQFVVYMNSSSEMTIASCWAGGVEIPCQNLGVYLKAARKPSNTDNTSDSESFVARIEKNDVQRNHHWQLMVFILNAQNGCTTPIKQVCVFAVIMIMTW